MLLLILLAATPNAASLSNARAMRGALVEEIQYQQPEGEQAGEQLQLSQMTKAQLRAELKRLEDNRPGLAGQITMVALGGATMAAGLLSLYVSFVFALIGSVPVVGLIIGAGLLLGGGALLTVGIIMLKMALNERRPFNEAMDEINQRLEGTFEEKREDGLPPPPPPLPPSDVAPPPPPPPSANVPNVRPSLVLATF